MLKDVIEEPTPTIYFFEAVGLKRVKIGFTRKPLCRFCQIRTACPVPVRVLAVMRGDSGLEAAYHNEWSHRRICGEWFAFSDEEIDEISKLRDDDPGFWQDFVRACLTAGMRDAFKYRESDQEAVVFAAFEELLPMILEGSCNE